MRELVRDIDGLLRGRFTRREDLALGRVRAPLGTLVLAGALLGAVYGAFMGLYAVLRPANPSVQQLFATTAKVPLLFLLTLVVTLPSLYVFSALSNSKLQLADTLRLLLAVIAVNLALLASFGPVTAFFTLSTESYPFMVVLNVAFFGVSGLVGLAFLRRALDRVFEPPRRARAPAEEDPEEAGEAREGESPAEIVEEKPEAEGGAAASGLSPQYVYPRSKRAPIESSRRIFTVWIVIYGAVGAQMGWILRPFVGTPGLPFELFRERESNFFQALFRALGQLLS